MKNQYEYVYSELKSTLLSDVENTIDGTETLLVGKVEDMKIRSSMKDGIFIEESFAIVSLTDPSKSIEIAVFQENLIKLKNMNLQDDIVFKVIITDSCLGLDLIKAIQVLDVISINEVEKYKI